MVSIIVRAPSSTVLTVTVGPRFSGFGVMRMVVIVAGPDYFDMRLYSVQSRKTYGLKGQSWIQKGILRLTTINL